MGRRYHEAEAKYLLPGFMRRDAFDAALAEAVDGFGADMHGMSRLFPTWNHVDELPEADVDALASEMGIAYYDKLADVDAKRAVVKASRRIQAKLGTKWALEEILKIYFDAGATVIEWPDYAREPGEPGHFYIETDYDAGTDEGVRRFMEIVAQVKRKGAVMDEVKAVTRSRADLGDACYVHEVSAEHMTMERRG